MPNLFDNVHNPSTDSESAGLSPDIECELKDEGEPGKQQEAVPRDIDE